ncbi:MAG: hypothetical protein P8N09_10195 [Planctomycetota bacterium]|jgi:hypothetical protein|nr:hypothetical protein [Planctomycetota bacterium]
MSIQGRRNVVFVVWAAVGVLLIWRGLLYTGFREETVDVTALHGNDRWIALGAALIVGIGKGFSALKKGARRAVTHIEKQGPQAPMWSVFSPVMILLVAIMVGAGLALRFAPYDAGVKAWIVGILYPAIGLSLIIGGLLARSVPPLEAKATR